MFLATKQKNDKIRECSEARIKNRATVFFCGELIKSKKSFKLHRVIKKW
jgi:hypothetical protein